MWSNVHDAIANATPRFDTSVDHTSVPSLTSTERVGCTGPSVRSCRQRRRIDLMGPRTIRVKNSAPPPHPSPSPKPDRPPPPTSISRLSPRAPRSAPSKGISRYVPNKRHAKRRNPSLDIISIPSHLRRPETRATEQSTRRRVRRRGRRANPKRDVPKSNRTRIRGFATPVP